jgi:hypothetical protein
LAVIPEKGRVFFACEKPPLSIDFISPAPQNWTRFAGTAV